MHLSAELQMDASKNRLFSLLRRYLPPHVHILMYAPLHEGVACVHISLRKVSWFFEVPSIRSVPLTTVPVSNLFFPFPLPLSMFP